MPQVLLSSVPGLGGREVGFDFGCLDMLGARIFEEASMLGPIVLMIVSAVDGLDDGGAINDYVRGYVAVDR
jgi:hypothetical protein